MNSSQNYFSKSRMRAWVNSYFFLQYFDLVKLLPTRKLLFALKNWFLHNVIMDTLLKRFHRSDFTKVYASHYADTLINQMIVLTL